MTEAEMSQLCLCNGSAVHLVYHSSVQQYCPHSHSLLQPRRAPPPLSSAAWRRRAGRGAACTAPPASAPSSSSRAGTPSTRPTRSTRAGGRSSRCSSSSSSSSLPAGVPGCTTISTIHLQQIFLPKDSDIFPKFYQIFSVYRFLINMIKWVAPTLGWEFNATQPFYYFSRIAKLLPVIHAMLNPIIYR